MASSRSIPSLLALIASLVVTVKAAEVTGLTSTQDCPNNQLTTCATNNFNVLNHLLNVSTSSLEIQLPAGEFPIKPLSITRSITLSGKGKGVTRLLTVGNGTAISIFGTTSRVTVKLLDLSVAGTAGAFTGISVKDGFDTELRNIYVDRPSVGVEISENNFTTRVSDITINAPYQGGLVLGKYQSTINTTQSNIDTFLTNLQVAGDYQPGVTIGAPNCNYGILIYSGTSGVYANRVSTARCGAGFIFDRHTQAASSSIIPEWIFCTDCLSDTNLGNGWEIRHARGVSLIGSWSGFNGKNGVYSDEGLGLIFNGFKSYNNGEAGISLDSNSKEVTITSSHIAQNNRNNVCASGVYIASGLRRMSITGNIISGQPIVDPSATRQMKCGIEIRDGSAIARVTASANVVENVQNTLCEPQASYPTICPFE